MNKLQKSLSFSNNSSSSISCDLLTSLIDPQSQVFLFFSEMEFSNDQSSIMGLPKEILLEIAKNMEASDLRRMRGVNLLWNQVASDQLRHNSSLTFNFDHYYRLLHFNDLFSCSPLTSSRSSAEFTFTSELLTKNQSLSPIRYFTKKFGASVTRVTLNYGNLNSEGQSISQREAVAANLTCLLSGVKPTLKELQLIDLVALNTSVLEMTLTPFPVLSKLKISFDSNDLKGEDATQQHAFLLQLAQLLPAIRILDFHVKEYDEMDDFTFVPIFLFYLGQQNPEFQCTLTLDMLCLSERNEFPVVWLRDATNIVDLTLSVGIGHGAQLSTQILFEWLEKKTKTLKKLTFHELYANPNFKFEFPTLEALEEFEFVAITNGAILDFKCPEKFPNLKKVTTRYSCQHFKVPMPKVQDLTICTVKFDEDDDDDDVDFQKMENLVIPFSNLRTLSCDEFFLAWDASFILKFSQLRLLNVQFNAAFMKGLNEHEAAKGNPAINRWNLYNGKLPQLDLGQILELRPLEDNQKGQGNPQGQDKNSEVGGAKAGVAGEPLQSVEVGKMDSREFKDLQNLEILKIVVVAGGTEVVDAILYLSKMKNLQCLKLLEINLQNGVQLPQIYVEELQKYHEKVMVI